MGPNNRSGDAATHLSDQIDLYLTGALGAAEEEQFEEHLLLCEACREQADRASEIAVAVAVLPADVVAELERSAATTPPGRAGRPADPAPAQREVPATGPAVRRPPGRPRTRARRVLSYVAVLLVGAAAGIGGVLVSHGLDADRVTVGNQSTAGSRGQLSVTMTARTGATDIRAIAVGLRPGDEYDLIVIGQDGRNYVAAHGVAAGGPQTIVGTAPVTRDEIRFFALTQGNLLLVAFGS